MNARPLVSVIVPIYNSGRFLKETLDCILSQSYDNFELIAINDGSTDDSLAILKNFAKQDSRIVIKDIQNSGASTARNIGLDVARGELVCFVDSDDLPTKNYIKTLVDLAISNNSDLACIQHTIFTTHKPDEILSNTTDTLDSDKAISALLLEKISAAPHCKIYRKDLLHSLRFKDYSIAEDLFFNYEYLKHCKRIVINPSRCYGYRRNNQGLSKKPFNTRRMDGLLATKAIFADSKTEQSAIRLFMEAEYILEAIAKSKGRHSAEKAECQSIIKRLRNKVLHSKLATSRQKAIASATLVSTTLPSKAVALRERLKK